MCSYSCCYRTISTMVIKPLYVTYLLITTFNSYSFLCCFNLKMAPSVYYIDNYIEGQNVFQSLQFHTSALHQHAVKNLFNMCYLKRLIKLSQLNVDRLNNFTRALDVLVRYFYLFFCSTHAWYQFWENARQTDEDTSGIIRRSVHFKIL